MSILTVYRCEECAQTDNGMFALMWVGMTAGIGNQQAGIHLHPKCILPWMNKWLTARGEPLLGIKDG